MMEDTKQKAQRKRRGQQSPQRNQPAAEAAGEATSSTSAGALSGIIHPGINGTLCEFIQIQNASPSCTLMSSVGTLSQT